MEVAVNVTSKLLEAFKDEFKQSGIALKTDEAKAKIGEILRKHAIELIGVKAIDQVHRRFVVDELRAAKPKVPKVVDNFDIALKEKNKYFAKLEQRANKNRSKKNGKWRDQREHEEVERMKARHKRRITHW